jgi:VCBS repeat-containing protein
VLEHELGHQIGLLDDYAAADAADLMYGFINAGERRLAAHNDVAGATGAPVDHESFVLSTVSVPSIAAGNSIDVSFRSTVNAYSPGTVPSLTGQSSVSYTGLVTPLTSTETITPTGDTSTASDGTVTHPNLTQATLTLGNLVFSDLNKNGIFDGTDTGIGNVTVKLYIDNGTAAGVWDAGDTQVTSTTTSNVAGTVGQYSFTNLAPGDYIVVIPSTNFASGQPLNALVPHSGALDPDNNTDNDNNGIAVSGGNVASQAITLAFDTETTNTAGADTNNTLDFGFQTNSPPVANADPLAATDEDTPAIYAASAFTGNDTDPDGDTFAITSVGSPSHGTAVLNGDGTVTYTPTGNYNGTDSFSYTITDSHGATASATASLTVNAVNDPVTVTVPSAPTINEDAGSTAISGMSIADVDATLAPNGIYQVVLAATHGTLTLTTTTGLTFSGGSDGTADATMTFSGKLADINAGLATAHFTADNNFNGDAQITLSATDNVGGTNATGSGSGTNASSPFLVHVTSINDAPSGQDSGTHVFDNDVHTFTAADFPFTDVESNPLGGVKVDDLPVKGTLLLNGSPVTAGTLISATDINAGHFTYDPDDTTGGQAYSFHFQVQDGGGTANGGVDLDPTQHVFTLTVDVSHINQAPAGTDFNTVIAEDGKDVFAASDFGFVDSDSAPYTNTLLAVKIATAPTNGTIYYDADNNAATPDTALGAGDSMSKIGLDAGQYYYKPNADYNGNDGFTFQVQDNGGTAHSGVDTDQSANSYTIAVNPVNDAPVNHVPSSPTIDEDTGITFSAANTNAITVSDVDAGSGTITVTVTSDHGILTPGSTNVPGATVSGGGFTPAVTISGTVSAVNAALDGLNYHTGLNFNGNDTITITTKDGGNTGSGGEQTTTTQLPVTVNPLNDAPTVVNGTTAAATAITEDSPSATGQTVSSLFSSHFSDATDNMAAYGGSSPNAFAGVFVSGNGSAAAQGQWQYYNGASWVDIGSVSETAAKFLSATTAIRFNPAQDFNGSAPTLTVHVADDSTAYSNGNTVDTNYGTALGAIGAWSVDTVTLSETVTAVDDNPVLATTGTSFNYTEGDPQHPLFATLTVSDVDNTNFNGGTLSIVDNAVNGTGDGLQLGGVASISFDPNTNEISYNNVVFGTLTFLANGYSIALNDKATPNAVQALLSDLQYVNTSDDPAAGDHPLLVTLTDGAGGSASFTTHVNVIPVNDPPLSDHLDGDVVTYTEDAPAVRTDNGHDATLSDPDNHTYGGATLVVSVSGNKVASEDQIVFLVPTIQAASTLSTSGGNLYFGSTQIGTISAGGVGLDRTVTFNSNADAGMVQLLLREIAYQDTNHATPSTAQRTIEYKITDPSSGVTTVHSLVNVADVNDPPVNTVPTPQTLNEDATLTFNTANGNVISVSDADAGSASLTATVSALHGSLMLSGTANLTVSGNGSETVHLAGSQADINAALQGLTYTPTPNYNGGDTLTLVTADNGNSGTGGNKTDTDTLAITVNAMNDAPVITSSPTVNATEQTPIVINPSLSVTDIDLDALNGGHGDYAGASFVINVPNTPNPDDVFGFDIADASFTVSGNNLQSGGQTFATFAMSGGILNISFTSSGTIATRLLVDDVLQHVTYENTSDAPPASETLGYGFIDGAPGHGQGTVVNNNNFAGNGVTVNIAAVDDAPTNHVPIGQNVNEDGTLVFSSGNANAITVTDPDSGSGSITVTLTAAHGTLTLGSTASVTPVNNGSGSVQVTGTAANVNAAMNGLTYAPTGDFNGDDTVTVATSDNSQTGSGGPLGDSDPVTIHVAAVNDAPTIVNAATATAPAIDEDVPSGAGDTVASLFGSHYSDAADDQSANGGSSAGAFSGIAVTGNLSGVAGQWQYWNGASWTNVGAVSNASALTLAASTAIRFNPAPDYNGAAPALTVHLADNTASITDGGHINLSGAGATGGTTPWSTGTVALAETVNPVDDAPVIDLDGGSAGFNSSGNFNEGDGPLLLAPNGTVVDVDSPDFDGGTLTVAFTGGSSQYDQLVVTGLDPDAGGQIFNGGGDVIATVAGGSDPSDPLIITFTSFATASDVQGVMHKVAYADYTNALTGGDRTISFTLTDGDGGTSNVATATVHVTAVDSPPVLTDDHVGTDEVSTVIIPVTANDSDPDGPPPAVTKINGSAISTGQTITLPSGAKLTLNADGTLTYDPNHQFDTLTSPSGGETGASNTSATDSFTYSVQDGSTASVSVQIDGVANAADHLEGSPGGDVIHGTPNADYFDFSQGGSDSGFGLGGNDAFFFGSAYDQDDTVDGGAGTDTVGIRGNYTGLNAITILGGNMVNTEVLNFMTSNGGPVGYDVTWQDGNLANGQKMSIYGGNLAAGENLTFDGSAETHGFFIMYGGLGTDNFKGGAGSDGFYFGPGKFSQADHVDGGGGTQNQLGLDGSYNFSSSSALGTLGGNFVNIQSIVLYNGNPADFSDPYPNVYHIETNDAAVGAGKTLAIYGALTVADFYFNGSAEMDGNFKIYGGIGNDTLIGGAGNDLIFGSQGSDTLTGGGGADTFVFTEVNQSTAASPDRITDFTNGDKIDLSQFDADTSTAGQQSFSFIGTGAFTNHAGELRAEFDAVHNIWTVQGDVDGDGHADLTILVSTTGGHAMTGTDFFL